MPRNLRQNEIQKIARNKRHDALARHELSQPSTPRTSAASPTSFALKAQDPAIRAMIDAEIERRRT